MARTEKPARLAGISPFGRIFRFIAYWFGFSGLYAAFAVCPFCGRQGCPVGMASTGTVGLFFAVCVQDWKRFFAFIRQKLKATRTLELSGVPNLHFGSVSMHPECEN